MKKFHPYILFILLLSSCETVVDVDLPIEAPQLVTNAIISPDSLIKVSVSQSRHILDDANFKTVSNARVSLYENGQLKEQLSELPEKGLYLSQFTPKAGHTYTLQVEAAGFQTVQASSLIKEKIPIQEIKLDSAITSSYEECYEDTCLTVSELKYQVALSFQDPAGEENFYEVSLKYTVWTPVLEYDDKGNYTITDTIAYTYPAYLTTGDPVFLEEFDIDNNSYTSDQLLFSDKIFNGKNYTLHFELGNSIQKNSRYTIKTEIVVLFKHITDAYYLYFRTRDLQNKTEDNPFAEPVPVYSNIENGYGIFAGYSADTYKIKTE